jgi:hypothetical protein
MVVSSSALSASSRGAGFTSRRRVSRRGCHVGAAQAIGEGIARRGAEWDHFPQSGKAALEERRSDSLNSREEEEEQWE